MLCLLQGFSPVIPPKALIRAACANRCPQLAQVTHQAQIVALCQFQLGVMLPLTVLCLALSFLQSLLSLLYLEGCYCMHTSVANIARRLQLAKLLKLNCRIW